MKLYLCPVCEKSCKQNRETCQEFEYGKAKWIFDQDCPECLKDNPRFSGMPLQDKFGACCAITNCKFEQEYK